MRLRQALASSAKLGVPNAFRVAIACDAFERIAPMTGRLETLLGLIWRTDAAVWNLGPLTLLDARAELLCLTRAAL